MVARQPQVRQERSRAARRADRACAAPPVRRRVHALLEREASWLPRWRELLRVYRRLEARGEIRGGRFASGLSGEQFALPEAVTALRAIRRRVADDSLISVSGPDSLNLAGILTPGPKLPALASNRVLYRDGMPIAFLEGDSTRFLVVNRCGRPRKVGAPSTVRRLIYYR
jgi:hypothetical protein